MVAPINLNRVRKTRARLAAQATAAENRIKFGRDKAERTIKRQADAAAARKLDGHKRDTPDQA